MLTPQELKEAAEFAEKKIEWEERRTKNLLKAAEQARKLRREPNIRKLIAVHMTDFFPIGGVIKTRSQSGDRYQIGQKSFSFFRETIHFTLNGPVGGHSLGNWEGKKYAILIPLPLIINRVFSLSPHDSWVVGNLTLPEGTEIIGKQKDLAKKQSPNVKKIIIKNEKSSYESVKDRIKEKGYHLALIGMWNWNFNAWGEALQSINEEIGDGRDIRRTFGELAKKIGKDTGGHNGSLFHSIENMISDAYKLLYGKDRGGWAKDHIERMQKKISELVEELKPIIKKKNSASTKNREEIAALLRLEDTLSHLYNEMPIILQKEIKEGSMFKEEIEAGKFEIKEKQWLEREYSFIKSLEPLIQLRDGRGLMRKLRKLSMIEAKLFESCEKLQKEIERLTTLDISFTYQIQDILEYFRFGQSHLAKFLSSNSDIIKSLIRQEKWDEVEEKISDLESIITGGITKLNDLHRILSQRKKLHKRKQKARHWKVSA